MDLGCVNSRSSSGIWSSLASALDSHQTRCCWRPTRLVNAVDPECCSASGFSKHHHGGFALRANSNGIPFNYGAAKSCRCVYGSILHVGIVAYRSCTFDPVSLDSTSGSRSASPLPEFPTFMGPVISFNPTAGAFSSVISRT